MISSFTPIFQGLLNVGTSSELNDGENQRIKSLNIVLVISLIMLLSSLSTNIIYWSWTPFDNLIYFGTLTITPSIFLLNFLGKYNFARFLFFFANALLLFFTTLSSGDIFLVAVLYIILLVTFFYFVEENKYRILYSVFQMLLFSSLVIIIHGFDFYPTPRKIKPISRIIVYFICYTLLYTLIKFLMAQIKSHHDEKEKLLLELKEKNKKVESAYKEMESFAYVISHDIKTPLRNMNSFAGLIQRDVQREKYDNLVSHSKFIKDSGTKLSRMIDDVLSYSKLNKVISIKNEAVDINKIIEIVKLNIRATYPIFDIQSDKIDPIIGNKSQLIMLFQNLIENGIKYNESEIPRIKISQQIKNNSHIIEVSDNGIGISEQHYEHVFDLFYRLHNDEEFEGTGIGLANCKKIVENHLDGSIQIESEINKGSTFIIRIPLV